MAYEQQGTLIEKKEVVSGSNAKGEYKYQNFIIEVVEEKYKRNILFTAFNKTIDYLNKKQVGDDIYVKFSIDNKKNDNHNNVVAFIIQ